MGSELQLYGEKPAKLIVNRRAIAAGLAALVSAPAAGRALAKELSQLSNVPLSFDPADFTGMMSGGLFLPDYRFPMVRLVFDNGETTGWHRYPHLTRSPFGERKVATRAAAIETCAPDKNGSPRYSQLAIG